MAIEEEEAARETMRATAEAAAGSADSAAGAQQHADECKEWESENVDGATHAEECDGEPGVESDEARDCAGAGAEAAEAAGSEAPSTWAQTRPNQITRRGAATATARAVAATTSAHVNG